MLCMVIRGHTTPEWELNSNLGLLYSNHCGIRALQPTTAKKLAFTGCYMATVETKAVMRGCADSGSCGVNVLKTQCRGDAGLLAGLLPPEPPGERRFAPE